MRYLGPPSLRDDDLARIEDIKANGALTFADAIGGDHTGYDAVRVSVVNGAAVYLPDGTTGAVSTGDEGKFFDATGDGYKLHDKDVSPQMFGAAGNGITDDAAALTKFTAITDREEIANFKFYGVYATSQPVDWDATNGAVKNIIGRPSFKALAPMDVLLTLTNLYAAVFSSGIEVVGTGGSTYSTRSVNTGIETLSCGRTDLGLVHAKYFKKYGVSTPSLGANSSFLKYTLIAHDCGAYGITGAGAVTAAYSNLVNEGSSGSLGQKTLIDVDNLPAEIEVNDKVIIGGYAHLITDVLAGQIKVIPWVPSTQPATGTLSYVVGAGALIDGSDAALMEVSIDAIRCGVGLDSRAVYGAQVSRLMTQACIIGYSFGLGVSSAHLGEVVSFLYCENNSVDLLKVTTSKTTGVKVNAPIMDIAKIQYVAPRLTNGKFSSTKIGMEGWSIDKLGRRIEHLQPFNNAMSSVNTLVMGEQVNTGWLTNGASTYTPVFDEDMHNLTGMSEMAFTVTRASAGVLGTVSIRPESGWSVMGSSSDYVYTPSTASVRVILVPYIGPQDWRVLVVESLPSEKAISTKASGAYTAVDADSLTYNRVDGSVTMHICGVDQVGKEFIFRNTAYANIALNAAAGVTFSGGSTIAQHEIIIAKCITSNGSTASHYELSGGTSA